MHDLDAAFGELRDDITAMTAGPSADEIVTRARRRTRRRVIAAGVATAVALGGFAVLHDRYTASPPVITTPSPTPTAKAVQHREFVNTDMLYFEDWSVWRKIVPGESEARFGRQTGAPLVEGDHWSVDHGTDMIGTVSSGKDTGAAIAGRAQGENVSSFKTVDEAKIMMADYMKHPLVGRTELTKNRLRLGAEAWSLVGVSRHDGKTITTQAVIFRQGRAIVSYWDGWVDSAGKRRTPLQTLADHEQDAIKMSTRLCSLGYGCP